MSLNDSLKAFKSRLRDAPVIAKTTTRHAVPDIPAESADVVPSVFVSQNVSLEEGEDGFTHPQIMRMVFEAISVLKTEDKVMSMADLGRRTNIDIDGIPRLWSLLVTNPRLSFEASKNTLQFKPKYNVKSKDDLLALINENRANSGLEVREMKESCKEVETFALELEREGLVFIHRNANGSARILYHTDKFLATVMGDDFREIWKTTIVPHETDLPRELEKAGLKTMTVFDKKASADGLKKAKKSRRGMRVKMTNTHISGMDFTKEYKKGGDAGSSKRK